MKKDISLDVLGLSKKEGRVLQALKDGMDTPLEIARTTNVSRPAAYDILKKLKERGLAVSRITGGKKHWQLAEDRQIEEALYEAKCALLGIPEGREEIRGQVDSAVVVHRGVPAIKALLGNLFARHSSERVYGFQGHVAKIGWTRIFFTGETNKINRDIKKNRIISEGILPEGWFEEQARLLGVEWAKEFEGRTNRINVIDPKYFEHGAQMWVFEHSLYLMAFNEEVVIEVRNSEIQKMILSIFEFMQDNSRTIDANALLRQLIEKHGEEQETESQ